MTTETTTRTTQAERFAPVEPERLAQWRAVFSAGSRRIFPHLVGLVLEDVRQDYARMRLPYRPELDQPNGVVHGGAIATLIDTVVVPAVASASRIDAVPSMLTVSMTIDYIGGLKGEDAIAEGWIDKRGKRTVFCAAQVRSNSGMLVARASLVYNVMAAKT